MNEFAIYVGPSQLEDVHFLHYGMTGKTAPYGQSKFVLFEPDGMKYCFLARPSELYDANNQADLRSKSCR